MGSPTKYLESDSALQPYAPLNTAVLFLVFNRPQVTSDVFEAIRRAKPPRLYIAADGPRSDRPGETERCAEVRRVVTAVDWQCEVKTMFRDNNLGCKEAVSSGISWFFDNEEEGIILEDDCLPDQSFFWFCEEMLQIYRQDTRIAMVAGTNLSSSPDTTGRSYFFSRLVQIWGWATWRRAWQLYDRDMLTWPKFKERNGFDDLGVNRAIADYVTPSFNKAYNNEVNTWDYQWSYCVLSNSMYVAVPNLNLIKNIGLGIDATHTTNPHGTYSQLTLHHISPPLTHPDFIVPSLKYDLEKVSHVSHGILTRIILRLKREFAGLISNIAS